MTNPRPYKREWWPTSGSRRRTAPTSSMTSSSSQTSLQCFPPYCHHHHQDSQCHHRFHHHYPCHRMNITLIITFKFMILSRFPPNFFSCSHLKTIVLIIIFLDTLKLSEIVLISCPLLLLILLDHPSTTSHFFSLKIMQATQKEKSSLSQTFIFWKISIRNSLKLQKQKGKIRFLLYLVLNCFGY